MTTPAHGSRASREPANRWRSSGQTGWDPDLASAGDDFGIAPLELAKLPDTDNRAAAVYLTTATALAGQRFSPFTGAAQGLPLAGVVVVSVLGFVVMVAGAGLFVSVDRAAQRQPQVGDLPGTVPVRSRAPPCRPEWRSGSGTVSITSTNSCSVLRPPHLGRQEPAAGAAAHRLPSGRGGH
jgi:hypothetical protein